MKIIIGVISEEYEVYDQLQRLFPDDWEVILQSFPLPESAFSDKPPHMWIVHFPTVDPPLIQNLEILRVRFFHIPILLISAETDARRLSSLFAPEIRIAAFIPVPWSVAELQEKVQQCLADAGINMALKILKSYRLNQSGNFSHHSHPDPGKILLEILDLIRNQPQHWTLGRLSKKYKKSRRQILRYIQKLQKTGWKISSSNRGYFLSQ